MSVGFLMYLFMNDLFTWMFVCGCCNLMMFYDWCECVMSVLGTTKHSTLGNKVVLYCIGCRLGLSRIMLDV